MVRKVGDYYAREKVSAFFRDMLHTNYRSSAKAKTARRRDRAKQNETQTQHYGQQLVEGTRHSNDGIENPDNFTMLSSSHQLVDGTEDSDDGAEHSDDGIGHSDDGIGHSDDGIGHSDDLTMSSPWSGSAKDSLGFVRSMEVDFFDIDGVFEN
jgi:hypothetical protein